MSNLKEIRTRIASVESTKKMTAAMKLVSAAKLRRAQNRVFNFKLYANKLTNLLNNIASYNELSGESPLFAVRKPVNVVLVVVTSNRGLCGAFNVNVIKEVHRIVHEEYKVKLLEEKFQLICIGNKAVEELQKNYKIRYRNDFLLEVPAFDEVAKMVSGLISDFNEKKIDKVVVVYNHFVNPATQKVTVEPFLPVEKTKEKTVAKNADFIFEPSWELLVDELIPKILKIQLYRIILDSIAAEHGARMTAMSKATESAIEILKDLKLKYNNARQAAITNELNEIVSGAEALSY